MQNKINVVIKYCDLNHMAGLYVNRRSSYNPAAAQLPILLKASSIVALVMYCIVELPVM